MAVRKVGTVPTPPKVKPVVIGDGGKFEGLLGSRRRFVQIAYALGESESDAADDIAAPVLALGDPVEVLAFSRHDETSSTSGGPKIPPGNQYLLAPGAVGGPMAKPELVGTIDVPNSIFVIDVLVKVRKR